MEEEYSMILINNSLDYLLDYYSEKKNLKNDLPLDTIERIKEFIIDKKKYF